ncbi:MAG TPA: molybdate ABC transporter substrate-binding protein [Longimicrobiaceae bacterium]|jgi:molybdate transport system substrate-binding protein|nr:molybdate ABC transporter substrate-binding protein [Longimicrobiaceae bacterium]
MRGRLAILLPLLAFASLGGCGDKRKTGDSGDAATVVTVSAASSLREVVDELARGYEAAHPGVRVRANFAASGALARQIEQGAPVDVFLSAAEKPMDDLQAKGLIDPRSRRVLAGNELVLVVPAAGASPVRGFADLALPAVKRVALGEPASVPAGEYAGQTLAALGLTAAVKPKVVYAQSVRQVLAYVERGDVDAGIVYRTDAAASAKVRVVAEAPSVTHRPIVYVIAVVKASGDAAAATAFAAYVLGPEGRAALRRHGFTVEG